MWWIDLFATYLYLLKLGALALAIALLISGIDDLIIDVVFWVRRAWRRVFIYRTHDRLTPETLSASSEKPFAIMVPAWRETGVIGRMAELAATTLDYENYQIFVGTYPNDPDTQRDVDVVCARFRNVQKVVCARPGPTSKADCLNNIVDAILQFERRANVRFAGFVLHDAEDVLSRMELRLFNYLVDRKDLIQLPVYPFERRWYHFTSGHYMDEFAELHGKDILVREAIAGQVPSAGVGTCFSRRAVLALLADGDGIAFDVQSLTEDYDIGFRLRAKGMSEVFVRFPESRRLRPGDQGPLGRAAADASVVCVREFFPSTFSGAVRQKARWIIGIVYQGYRTHGWTRSVTLNYFLWRDRKGALNNFVSFLATLVFAQLVALWAYQRWVPGAYRFIDIFEGRLLTTLLAVNFVLMCNRLFQRAWFVTTYYGVFEGLLAVLRCFWGNVINFAANCRAVRQILLYGDPHRVAWDKTTHDFPTLVEASRARRPLGEILIEQRVLDRPALEATLAAPIRGLKIGSALVHAGVIAPEQLAGAVAAQCEVSWEPVDALTIAPRLIDAVPGELALHYAVLPVGEAGRTLVVASESELDPVSLAALSRKLGRPVQYVIAPKGQVTVGLRHWYARLRGDDPRLELERAVAAGRLAAVDVEPVWRRYVSRQVLFAEVLMSLGHLDPTALKAVLVRHERTTLSLGDFLVQEGIVPATLLREALTRQQELQGTIETFIADVAAPPEPMRVLGRAV